MKGIADTGFLVAFANRNDAHHEWAVQVAEQLSEPLLTCEAVLAETAFHLQDAALVFSMLREGLVALAEREHRIRLFRSRGGDEGPTAFLIDIRCVMH